MRRLLLLGVFAVGSTLVWPSVASASLSQGLLKLAAGRRDCRAKRFAKGLKELLGSALLIQSADRRHPANRLWLPAARRCLRSWVLHTANRCKGQGQVSSLRLLLQIRNRIKYLSAPVARRMIKARLKLCARSIVRLRVKECQATPNRAALSRMDRLTRALVGLKVSSRVLARLGKGRNRCAYLWIREAGSRCKVSPSVATLREIGSAVVQVKGRYRGKARAAYEACARSLGSLGWQSCQRMRFVEGRRLLLAAISRYDFFHAKDRRFLTKMKKRWLPRCGTYLLSGRVRMRVKAGRVSYKLLASLRVEVSRTGAGNNLAGALYVTYSGVSGVRAGCRVLITPTDGRYLLSGSESRAANKLYLMLKTGTVQKVAREEMQITCGNGTPVQTKTRYVHKLLKASGILSIRMFTGPRSAARFRYTGPLGAGISGSLVGTLEIRKLK